MFDHLQTRSLLGVSAQELSSFVASVHDGYNRGSAGLQFNRYYHNFSHAFDVTQTLFAIFGFAGSHELLSPLEKVVLLLAAIGHDIAHPGVSNHFVVVTNHPLAIAYGFTSVLENMHAAKTMALVESHDLLRNLAANHKMRAQQLLVCSILGTDVAQHDRLMHDVEGIVSQRSLPLSSHCGVHSRLRVGSFLLHCADVSNAAKPFHIAERWTELLMMEFFEQGEAEKRVGLPVSPSCDADTTRIPELQIRFITFAILPTFSLLKRLLPDAHVALHHASDNVRQWERRRAGVPPPRAPQPPTSCADDSNAWTLGSIGRTTPGAYWHTLLTLARFFAWGCAVVGPTLVDCLVLDDVSGTFPPKPRASVVVPTCLLIAAALRSTFSDATLFLRA